ncbi:hypothetical protein AAY473_027077 [Plecturocebus cupreus]
MIDHLYRNGRKGTLFRRTYVPSLWLMMSSPVTLAWVQDPKEPWGAKKVLACSTSIVDWAHTYAQVTNVFNCCICNILPAAAADSLPSHMHPASVQNCTWLKTWGPTDNGWDASRWALDRTHCKTHGKAATWLTHSIHDGWGWLTGNHMVPPLQVP